MPHRAARIRGHRERGAIRPREARRVGEASAVGDLGYRQRGTTRIGEIAIDRGEPASAHFGGERKSGFTQQGVQGAARYAARRRRLLSALR